MTLLIGSYLRSELFLRQKYTSLDGAIKLWMIGTIKENKRKFKNVLLPAFCPPALQLSSTCWKHCKSLIRGGFWCIRSSKPVPCANCLTGDTWWCLSLGRSSEYLKNLHMCLKPGPNSGRHFELGFLKIHSAVWRNCTPVCFPTYVYTKYSNFAEVESEINVGM